MIEFLVSQIIDPFRIGLIFFLLLTAIRTRREMGMRAPLAMGVVFIAILLPLTTGATVDPEGSTRLFSILCGIIANAIILAVFLGGWFVWERRRN